jgi:hypothetical protein
MHTRLLCLLAIACSSSPTKAEPPVFATVNAPTHVAASADGSYNWAFTYSYQDPDDFATTLRVTFTPGNTSSSYDLPCQAATLSQMQSVSIIPTNAPSFKGKTLPYTFVLIDQSGLQSTPYSGSVTFD